MPLVEELFKAYRTYYTHASEDAAVRGASRRSVLGWILHQGYKNLLKVTRIMRERERLDTLYLDRVRPGKLLEVGCGDGRRLAMMRDLGWEVRGQDVDSRAVEHARSAYDLDIHCGPLDELREANGAFNALILNHVIEHVPDPVETLVACRRLLKPGAPLVAATPNIESYGHTRFGWAWLALDPPRHLHLFSPRLLLRTATRAGFADVRVWTTPANAQMISAGSRDIARQGRHRLGKYSSVRNQASSALFQVLAKIHHLFQAGSGEECVLWATR